MHLWGLPDDTYPCVYVLVQLGQCSRGTENESATHEDARGQGVMTPLREREREGEGGVGGWVADEELDPSAGSPIRGTLNTRTHRHGTPSGRSFT